MIDNENHRNILLKDKSPYVQNCTIRKVNKEQTEKCSLCIKTGHLVSHFDLLAIEILFTTKIRQSTPEA